MEKADSPFASCAFFIRGGDGCSDDLLHFMLDLAIAADLTILAAMEPLVPVIVSESQRAHLPADMAAAEHPPALCQTPEELRRVLMGGYDEWRRYLDFLIDEGFKRWEPR